MRPIYECPENYMYRKRKISRGLRKNLHNPHYLHVNIASLFTFGFYTIPINKYVKAKLELDNPNHNLGSIGGWPLGYKERRCWLVKANYPCN